MIGCFGDLVFETSDRLIRTFNRFSRAKKHRHAIFDILDTTQKVQYIGENLAEIEITIVLDRRNVCPEEELKRIESMQGGIAYRLIIGGKNFGRFYLEEHTENYKHVNNKGELIFVEVTLKLREYR